MSAERDRLAAEIDGVPIDTSRLPPQLRELIKNIGFEAAVKLVKSIGGTSMYVPQGDKDEHPALLAIGPDAFAKLVENYGGLNMTVPKFDSLRTQIRHWQVIELITQGESVRCTALKTGYCVRSVELIVLRHQK